MIVILENIAKFRYSLFVLAILEFAVTITFLHVLLHAYDLLLSNNVDNLQAGLYYSYSLLEYPH